MYMENSAEGGLISAGVLQPQCMGKADIDLQDVARCDKASIKKVFAFTPHTRRDNIRSLLGDDIRELGTSARCRNTFYKSLQNPILGDDEDSSCPSPMSFDVKTAQRSSARAVKNLLAKVGTICREHQQSLDRDSAVPPPMEAYSILANWAKDSYYVVVMIKNESIPITVSAMHAFSSHPEFLVVCCEMLKSFCEQGECYQKTVKTSGGGVGVMLDNIRNHPGSSTVQYAAREALQSLTSLPEQTNHPLMAPDLTHRVIKDQHPS